MARKMVSTRLTTPIVIQKTLKTRLRKLAKDHTTRKGTESDNDVLLRLVIEYETNHPDEIRIPQSTYREKPALLTTTF